MLHLQKQQARIASGARAGPIGGNMAAGRRSCRRPAVAANATTTTATAAQRAASAAAAALIALTSTTPAAFARPEGVNKPELLPKEPGVTVIDVAGFLAPSEETRLRQTIANLEKDTGYRLRVLAQNYPLTPGLAVRDYWQVDENTVVFVADPSFGDIVNVNVGANLDLEVPRNFWSRLASKFGNRFYVRDNGEAAAITNTVAAIDACLREESGRAKCSAIVDVSDELGGGGGF
jgi:hypothetical protein